MQRLAEANIIKVTIILVINKQNSIKKNSNNKVAEKKREKKMKKDYPELINRKRACIHESLVKNIYNIKTFANFTIYC